MDQRWKRIGWILLAVFTCGWGLRAGAPPLATALLHDAAGSGSADEMALLLLLGPDIEAQDAEDRRPLHMAAAAGNTQVTQLLLDAGAQVDAQDKHRRTPLYWAAWSGHAADVELLLDHHASPESQSEAGGTPLHVAASRGHLQVAKTLIQHGSALDARCFRRARTPLHRAVWNQHHRVVGLLLENGADPLIADRRGRSPMAVGLGRTDPQVVRALLHYLDRHQDDPALKEYWLQQGLHAAIRRGFREVAEWMLQRGARLDHVEADGRSVLHEAAAAGDLAMAAWLMQSGVRPDVTDNRGRTPLFDAARFGRTGMIELLLDAGAAVDVRSHAGGTALIECAGAYLTDRDATPAAQLLIQKGAEVQAVTKADRTALHQAAMVGSPQMAELLIEHGADVRARGEHCSAPLFITVGYFGMGYGRQLEVAKLLLENGASLADSNDKGVMPLQAAVELQFEPMIRLLQSHAQNTDRVATRR